ncbi:MAG: YggT family protein [Clostridium sp.]
MEGILITFVSLLFRLLEFAILIECLLSWIVRGPNILMDTLQAFTRPVLEPFRMLQNKMFGQTAIDFSPILALIAIDIIRALIFSVLI